MRLTRRRTYVWRLTMTKIVRVVLRVLTMPVVLLGYITIVSMIALWMFVWED